jgi:hypothetical protein
MNDMYDPPDSGRRLPIWLVLFLVTVILLTVGVQTAAAGFCWAG